MIKNKFVYTLSFFLFLIGCTKKTNHKPNYKVHTFYYNWYGNPKNDGDFYHWSHNILPHWSDKTWDNAGKFPGGNDIGANFYPELGTYSSNNPETIKKHMEMIQSANIGVLAITWWGKDSYEDKSIKTYLDIAKSYQLKVAIHVEPFYSSAKEFKHQLNYLIKTYGEHPALYKVNNKPFLYVYDSYKLTAKEWRKVLHPEGEISVRNTKNDAIFIGLWVEENHGRLIKNSNFDGFYTYFASNGFVYGSTTENWKDMSKFAQQNNLIFIPCAGPGYIDTRIRPWNQANTKLRNKGAYYENMFNAAIKVKPDYIGITSFNEWHEGTQIEPSVPKTFKNYEYKDFSETNDSWFYLKKTKELISKFK